MFKVGYGGYIKTIETSSKFKDILDDGEGWYESDNEQLTETIAKNILTDYILFSLKTRVQYKLQPLVKPPFKIVYTNYYTNEDFGFDIQLIRGRYEISDLDDEKKDSIQKLINQELYSDDYCLLFVGDCLFFESKYIPEYWITEYLKTIKHFHLKPDAKLYKYGTGVIEVEHNVDIKIPLITKQYQNINHSYSTPLFCVNLRDFFHYELVFNKMLRALVQHIYNVYRKNIIYISPDNMSMLKEKNLNSTSVNNFYTSNEINTFDELQDFVYE